ncbi:MAG TPA: DUF4340 domain-containing protein [Anaerolineaceae bacterium]|nr:DUF4340 domain-containing protein [Anaerolineaceae bacterium]
MNKTQKYLLGILAVQLILIAVVFLLQRPVAASNNLVFPELKIESVSEIRISDSSGNQVSIQKKAGQWVLPLQDDFPVQAEKVEQLIEKLALIRDNRMITQSESSHQRLSISNDNFISKVDLTIDGKKEAIYFGSSPASSNIHYRLDGKPEVYLTNAITTSELAATISSWVNTIIYQVTGNNIQKIELSNQNGVYQFMAVDETSWTSDQIEDGYQFDQSKWSSLKTAFSTLRFVEPVSKTNQPEFGLDNPTTTMKIDYVNDSAEEFSGELQIGNQADDGFFYVKWSGSDYIYKVSSFNAERFTNLTAEDYSSPIPTEEPGEE